jgi:hypothetical protein
MHWSCISQKTTLIMHNLVAGPMHYPICIMDPISPRSMVVPVWKPCSMRIMHDYVMHYENINCKWLTTGLQVARYVRHRPRGDARLWFRNPYHFERLSSKSYWRPLVSRLVSEVLSALPHLARTATYTLWYPLFTVCLKIPHRFKSNINGKG